MIVLYVMKIHKQYNYNIYLNVNVKIKYVNNVFIYYNNKNVYYVNKTIIITKIDFYKYFFYFLFSL